MCNSCFEKTEDKSGFKIVSIAKDYWTRVNNETKSDAEGPSKLTAIQQHQLLQHALEHGLDNWHEIAKTLGLENGQEAIKEFLKIK